MYGENSENPDTQRVALVLAPSRYPNRDPAPKAKSDIQFDQMNCIPDTKVPKCCKVKGCKFRSQVRCEKCQIYLCLNADRNCLKYFTSANYVPKYLCK